MFDEDYKSQTFDYRISSPDGRGVKQRLAHIDYELNTAKGDISEAKEILTKLQNASSDGSQRLDDIVSMLRAEMDTKINELRSAMSHRNDLQTSENSRLQASIASLKSENSQLNKKLANVLQRLEILEKEMNS